MTDEFDPSMPIFGPDMPEEVKDQIIRRAEYHKLTNQDNAHAARTLMDELNSDQLAALDVIVTAVMINPEYNAGFIRGEIAMRRWSDFNVCPCGGDHDPDKEFATAKPEGNLDEIVSEDDELRRLLEEYNLVVTGNDHGDTWYECKGCNMTYSSLNDRMLKPPGINGCGGCQNKEKFG